MKRYRTTKMWWDVYGRKHLPQEVLREEEVFYIVDIDGKNTGIFPKECIEAGADWIEEIKDDDIKNQYCEPEFEAGKTPNFFQKCKYCGEWFSIDKIPLCSVQTGKIKPVASTEVGALRDKLNEVITKLNDKLNSIE